MDNIGALKLAWAQGYDGGQASYINRDTICFRCGNNIKFMSEDGDESIFPSGGEALGAIGVHPVNKAFAVSEIGINPKICIYDFPSFSLTTELADGAKLEYELLVFSHSDYLATITAVPDHKLILWNYRTGEKLCVYDLKHETPTAMTFNPANWREICITYTNELSLYKIEQSDNEYIIQRQKLKLPFEDTTVVAGFDDDRDLEMPTRANTRMSRGSVKLPLSSVAGVRGKDAERYVEHKDMTSRVKPKSHCWLPSGDVLIGCLSGQMLKVDGETLKVHVIYNPGPRASSSMSRVASANLGAKAIPEANESDSSYDGGDIMADGSLNCLILHKKGLFAGGQDGTLRKLELQNEQVRIVDSNSLGTPITSLSFNTTYSKIAVGSDRGCIDIFDPADLSATKQLFNIQSGKFVAVDVISPGVEYAVTARSDGELQIWNINNSKVVGSLSIGLQITSLAASPFGHVVVVGTITGHLLYVEVTKAENPRIIQRVHMHSGPVKQIVFNQPGYLLFTGSDDGHIYVMDGRCTQNFKCMGFVAMPGEVEAIGTFYSEKTNNTKVVVTSNNTAGKISGANRIVYFSIPPDLDRDIEIKHQSLKWELKDSLIEKLTYYFANPSCGMAVGDPNVVFALTQNTKQLHKIQLPSIPSKKEFSKDAFLRPVLTTTGHQLPGGKLVMSPHNKWLSSVGPDGKLTVRTVGNLDRPIELNAHDFRLGGASDVCFTTDTHGMLTVGQDGSLVCYKWIFQGNYSSKAKSAKQHIRDRETELQGEIGAENAALETHAEWQRESLTTRDSLHELERQKTFDKEQAIEKAIEADEIFRTPTPVPGADATWMQAKELEAHGKENMQYSDIKRDLREKIRDMREMLQGMMKENEQVPDIEKLEHHDFDLDVEEQQRLQEEGDAEVTRIREEKELENLAKMYVADLIKRECWDDMVVKGRGIAGFQGDIEVHNYAMKTRPQAELERLETIKERRRIELAEMAKRKEIAEIHPKSVDDEENGDEEEDKGEKPSTSGSLGALYGGGSDLLYTQFELHTREEKSSQVVLLEDAIYRIKETFNKEFDEVFAKKENEISKIKDKNKRIRKIVGDLSLTDAIYEPEMGTIEKPEKLLTVLDEEVTVEKYLTPEQRKQMESERKEEEERRAKEKRDNWRERGLDKMMGGLLEIKKEDELKKDVPRPAFMNAKAEDAWTDEEKKAAQEYEKKVKELQEEREKYRKQLEMEYKKLQSVIQDATDQFDEALKTLFLRKIKTEMVIYQEELKIVRLKHSLLVEEEFLNREAELVDLVQHKRQVKVLAQHAVLESSKHVEQFRDLYDRLQAEDKVMDRDFKRKFNDIPSFHVDLLYKLFRRRPRGQKARGAETPIYDPNSGNPFGDRPATARQNHSTLKTVETALKELDSEKNCPDGVAAEVWGRLCAYRRGKVESERLVQQKALVLAEMQAFAQRRHEEEEHLFHEIEDLSMAFQQLHEDRNRFNLNLEVQLMLKQGQVEVDQGYFIPDYRDSLLIHRHVVEDLNGKVRTLGESKIASMEDSKVFRKGIVMLEWEHKKMTMEMEDLQKKMRDVQNMKVTREIQRYLGCDDNEARKAHDISILEQTLIVLKEHHEKTVEEKTRIWKELKRTVKDRDGENGALKYELEDLNVSVNERRHIHSVNADKRSDAGQEQRYREIVQRRKLVDLAKAQAQEVAVLRAEVERLRMRTFPALVQVEH